MIDWWNQIETIGNQNINCKSTLNTENEHWHTKKCLSNNMKKFHRLPTYFSSATAKHSSRTRIPSSCFQSCKLPPLHECCDQERSSRLSTMCPNETFVFCFLRFTHINQFADHRFLSRKKLFTITLTDGKKHCFVFSIWYL